MSSSILTMGHGQPYVNVSIISHWTPASFDKGLLKFKDTLDQNIPEILNYTAMSMESRCQDLATKYSMPARMWRHEILSSISETQHHHSTIHIRKRSRIHFQRFFRHLAALGDGIYLRRHMDRMSWRPWNPPLQCYFRENCGHHGFMRRNLTSSSALPRISPSVGPAVVEFQYTHATFQSMTTKVDFHQVSRNQTNALL